MDTYSLIDLETKSARISAALDLRPELANIWRQSVAFSEAGANLALEDISVTESDLVNNLVSGEISTTDPQAVAISAEVHKSLLSPGHIMSDPALVFDRAHRAGRISSLVDIDEGGRASYPRPDQDEGWQEARDLFVTGARRILRAKGAISLKSISVAALLTEISPERHPIAERIIMMAAESYLRQDLALKDPIVSPSYKELPSAGQVYWTFLPGISLSRGVFRAWSPGTPKGQGELINRLAATLSREAGRIGYIHDWMKRAKRDFVGHNRRSRRTELVQLSFTSPILDAATVADQLSCTERAARTLLSDAADEGILRPITTRKTYRLWSVPALHELLKERAGVTDLRKNASFHEETKITVPEKGAAKVTPRPRIDDEEKLESRLDEMLAKMDDILNASDKLLQRARGENTAYS